MARANTLASYAAYAAHFRSGIVGWHIHCVSKPYRTSRGTVWKQTKDYRALSPGKQLGGEVASNRKRYLKAQEWIEG
jgi:hypothetical protein